MDEEAKKMVDAAYERTLDLMREKQSEVTAIAEMLLEKETINHDDIVSAIGHRPFEPNKQYAEFISNAWKRAEEEKANSADKEAEEEQPAGSMPPGMSPA